MKITQNFAVAFAPQVADGTYNAGLDAIAANLADTDGLVLGASGEGQADSGIDVDFEALRELAAVVPGSLTRSPGKVLRRRVVLTFAMPWCGNRQTASTPPVDGDFVPSVGMGALLAMAGFEVDAWASGVGQAAAPGDTAKGSSLLYVNGQRFELLDCLANATIAYTPNGTPIATFEVTVGSVKDAAAAALPTLDFGEQQTVQAPIVESAAHTWGLLRGFQSLEIEIANEIEDTPDSNAPSGLIPERTARTITISATLFKDDADALFEWTQLGEDEAANLEPLSFIVGTPAVAGGPCLAIGVSIPMPELVSFREVALADKGGVEIELAARHTTGNAEIEFIFQ